MRNTLVLIFVVFFALSYAVDKPTNYFAGTTSVRGGQQQQNGFAVWNLTSSSWINALPPNTGTGNIYGILTVGTGLVAYGDFQSLGGKDAAGVAYYDGSVWCTPEGVGLFTYTPNIFTTQYNNTPTAKGGAFAGTVIGTDVYLLGNFNQVGLVRDGVAGFVRLSWSAGGIFTINKVGANGYNQITNSLPCVNCPRSTQPAGSPFGSPNKLMSYTANSQTYFVYQDTLPGNLFQFQVDSPSWNTITGQNNGRNLTGAIRDFDINNGNIYVVGQFQNLNDPTPGNQYLHIATSSNQGSSWAAVASPQPLPIENFGSLGVLINNQTGIQLPALTGTGFTAIAVENANSIYVAGGWRVTERNITNDNLAGQLQTRVIKITGSTYSLASERWAGSTFTGTEFTGPTINRLTLANGILYAFGNFLSYRQVIPLQGSRFGNRMTEVYRGAAQLNNGQWSPAFGGYLTTTYSGDTSTTAVNVAFSSNTFCFTGLNSNILSTYNSLSGGVFAYGGDKNAKKNNRWNAALQNQRFVTALNGNNAGVGTEGFVTALHVTKSNDVLIIGGIFDWIGSQRIAGIAAYNPISDTVQQIGGGIYQNNQNFGYGGDNFYNNRIGGSVNDIEEWNKRLIIAGTFNRNNSGNCVSNIAWNKFRENGAGWESLDGGCDGTVYDVLVVGDILYVTGDFLYCGLAPAKYTGGLYRGNVPTSKIARIDLSDNKRSWRNLGVGLSGGGGRTMAWRNGDLFVGGTFTSAGQRIATSGIARWRNGHWYDVVAKCRDACDRPTNVFRYITDAVVVQPTTRKPTRCSALKNVGGRIYCIDAGVARLAYFDSDSWYQAGDAVVTIGNALQNSLIMVNGTNTNYIIVPSTSTDGANGANYAAYDSANQDYDASNGGFSNPPLAFASASSISISKLIIAILLFVFAFFF